MSIGMSMILMAYGIRESYQRNKVMTLLKSTKCKTCLILLGKARLSLHTIVGPSDQEPDISNTKHSNTRWE